MYKRMLFMFYQNIYFNIGCVNKWQRYKKLLRESTTYLLSVVKHEIILFAQHFFLSFFCSLPFKYQLPAYIPSQGISQTLNRNTNGKWIISLENSYISLGIIYSAENSVWIAYSLINKITLNIKGAQQRNSKHRVAIVSRRFVFGLNAYFQFYGYGQRC